MGKGRKAALRSALALGLVFGTGCGNDTSVEDDGGSGDEGGGDTDVDAGADADADAETESEADAGPDEGGGTGTLTVTVLERSDRWIYPVWDPIPDAVVAFDPPTGSRVEATTDEEGHVTFDGFDWAGGTAAVTAWAEGHSLASRVGLDEASEDPILLLTRYDDPNPEAVTVTVTAENRPEPTHDFLTGAAGLGAYDQGGGATRALRVPPGEALTIFGAQWQYTEVPATHGFEQPFDAWVVATAGPFDADATVTLDFAAPATPTTVHRTFGLPARADSPLRDGGAYVVVHGRLEANPGRLAWPWVSSPFGWATHMERSTEGNAYSMELEFLTTAPADEAGTVYQIYGDDGDASTVHAHGYPSEGPLDCEFLDVPTMITPASVTVRHPLHEPIAWETEHTGVVTAVYIIDSDSAVWAVEGPTDATTLTVPEPPSPVGAAAVLEEGVFRAAVEIADRPTEGECFLRWAEPFMFTLVGP